MMKIYSHLPSSLDLFAECKEMGITFVRVDQEDIALAMGDSLFN